MAGPTQIPLDVALNQILTAARDLIEAGRSAGHITVDELRIGVLGRRQLTAPGIAVTSPAAAAEHARALHEQWEIPLELWGVVSTEEPGGEVEATRLALRARSLVLADRSLGLPYVEDVQSRDWEVLGAQSSGRRVLARARLNVRVSIVEPKELP